MRYKCYIEECGGIIIQRKNPWLRRYLLGCATGLNSKLETERRVIEKEREKILSENNSSSCNVTALALKKTTAIVEYMNKNYKMGNPHKSKQLSFTDATMIGYKDGRNVNINKPIDGTYGNFNALCE